MLNVRVHPEQDAAEAQAAVMRPPASRCARSGSSSTRQPGATGNGFAPRPTGPAYEAARAAWSAAWGADVRWPASGGSIPIVSALQRARVPERRGPARRHRPTATRTSTAPNERVLLDEFEKAIVAEADFFGRYAEAFTAGSSEEDA